MMEHKLFGFEVKSVEDEGTFIGYASTFGNTDLVGDIVEAGAFTQSINETKGVFPILWQHDYRKPVGFGVEAVQDFKGLLVKGELTISKPDGRDAHETLKHAQKVGHKMGISIGFTLDKKGSWEMDGTIRRLKKINLQEYSIVTFPANPKARVSGVKSVEAMTERDFEDFLREAGFSKSEALCVISKGFKQLLSEKQLKERREAGSDQDEVPADVEAWLHELKTTIHANAVDSWLATMSHKKL